MSAASYVLSTLARFASDCVDDTRMPLYHISVVMSFITHAAKILK